MDNKLKKKISFKFYTNLKKIVFKFLLKKLMKIALCGMTSAIFEKR